MIAFLLWLILLILAPVVALLALVLYPLVWLLMLPFRLIGISVGAVFGVLEGALRLPGLILQGPKRA